MDAMMRENLRAVRVGLSRQLKVGYFVGAWNHRNIGQLHHRPASIRLAHYAVE